MTTRAESRGSESEEESKDWADRVQAESKKIHENDRISDGEDTPSGDNLIKGIKKTTFDIN
ncbi:hypothetical protein N8766_02285 [bacterium]|nr:hypothetical protein [bacterium]